MTPERRDDDDAGENEYRGPKRRKTDNGVHLQGPTWIGSMSLSGAYTIPALALIIVAAAAGASVYFNYKAMVTLRDTAGIEHTHIAASIDRQTEIIRQQSYGIEEQNEISSQTLCMIALKDSKDQINALRSGDVCAYLGVRGKKRLRDFSDPPPRRERGSNG